MVTVGMRLFLATVLMAGVGELVDAQFNYSYFDPDYGKTWMYFPDGDGNPQVMYLTEPKPISRNDERRRPVREQVNFMLYTRKNQRAPKKTQLREKRGSLDEFNYFYNADLPTYVLVHGWKSSTESDTIQNIKNAYLQTRDCNVIAVDWQKVASNNYYVASARQTKDVGRYTAEMIDYLCMERGADIKKFHLVGHSLGAHTVGYAGSYVKSGKIPRISGLDPARPLFEGNTGPEGSLDKSDAGFVDVIHSCGGTLGYAAPIGHVDFYPNNGRAFQPGCNGIMQEMLEACSHGRSHQFFAESITTKKGFIGYPCESWEAYNQGKCKENPTPMGEPTPTSTTGIYYLRTSDKKPYALG